MFNFGTDGISSGFEIVLQGVTDLQSQKTHFHTLVQNFRSVNVTITSRGIKYKQHFLISLSFLTNPTSTIQSLRKVQFSSVAQSCPTLCDPMNRSMPGLPVHHTLHMRWPKYQSFSFSIIPSKEHPGMVSFRMDWVDLYVSVMKKAEDQAMSNRNRLKALLSSTGDSSCSKHEFCLDYKGKSLFGLAELGR